MAGKNINDKETVNLQSDIYNMTNLNTASSSVSYPNTRRDLTNVFNKRKKPLNFHFEPVPLAVVLSEYLMETSPRMPNKIAENNSDEENCSLSESGEINGESILDRTMIDESIDSDSMSGIQLIKTTNCQTSDSPTISFSKPVIRISENKMSNDYKHDEIRDKININMHDIFQTSIPKKISSLNSNTMDDIGENKKTDFENPYAFMNDRKNINSIKKTSESKYITPKRSTIQVSPQKSSKLIITKNKESVLVEKELNIIENENDKLESKISNNNIDKKIKRNIQFSLPINHAVPTPLRRTTKPLETPLRTLSRISETTPRVNINSVETPISIRSNPVSTSRPVVTPLRILSNSTNTSNNNFKTIQVKGKDYIVISKLGEGGSCQVFDCLDQDTLEHRAIKIVNLAVDTVTAHGYINEVKMLRTLQGNEYVIKMFDYEISHKKLFVIMEKGGIDLSVFLRNIATKSSQLPIHVINYYWMEMLNCVKEIHDAGIIHSDLKPSNFLIVDGRLKLIDFGIATRLSADMTSVIKNVQVGTFNYISPEALLDSRGTESPNDGRPRIKISFKSDVWSLGCILYQLVYRKTPFHNIGSTFAKICVIADPEHTIEYPEIENVPPNCIEIIKKCLQYDIKRRPTVSELLSFYNSAIC